MPLFVLAFSLFSLWSYEFGKLDKSKSLASDIRDDASRIGQTLNARKSSFNLSIQESIIVTASLSSQLFRRVRHPSA